MKKIFLIAFLLIGCGYSSRGNTGTGQVKKVHGYTPIVCPDREVVDISLGVMRNGVGSMSTQDVHLVVYDASMLATAKEAAASGTLVDFTYDEARVRFCNENEELTAISIVK